MLAAARGSRLLLTHQKTVRGRGGFGAPGAGKHPRRGWGAGGHCSGEPHGWQLPEPPAVWLPPSDRRLDHPPHLPTLGGLLGPGVGVGVVESFQPGMVMSKSCSQESTLAGVLPKVAGVCPCLCLHCGLDSFLRGLTLTRTLSREATLRLWTPLAGSKPGSRSVLSLMADRKAPAALWKCSQGVREFSERGVDLEGLLSVWCPPCPKQGQIL